jgi:uncharacterized repeat protein (TIGR03803 family)
MKGAANGDGTVFSVTTSGAETMLYSFKGGLGDGVGPQAGLLYVKGKLYGTTFLGGANVYGTLFSVMTSGKETVLHGFGAYGDGKNPEASLLDVKGAIYGTTVYGGSCYGYGFCGTVFSITTSGTETVLHSFGGPGDGIYPYAALLDVKGTLYGTTYGGGANGDGTVFSLTPSGKETVLYSFKGGSGDGKDPYAGLINVKGTLYGATFQGGVNGDGTVFSITPSGKETVLYSFKGGSGDGEDPYATLLDVKGTLYGTTCYGGANGYGTVFSITTSGKETVLHSFSGSGDGEDPYAALINVKGTLYGTTFEGGTKDAGTVFSLSP